MKDMIKLWQEASIDETGMDKVYSAEDLVPLIINLQHKQQRLVRFKTLSVIIILLSLVIIFFNSTSINIFNGLGLGIFLGSVIAVVILVNRLRFRIRDEERSLSTLRLSELTERKINTERRLFTLYFPLFVLVALLGFNLMYIDVFEGEEPGTRLLYHLAMSAGVLLGFILGLLVRIRRFKRQFMPVQERINKFREEAEAD